VRTSLAPPPAPPTTDAQPLDVIEFVPPPLEPAAAVKVPSTFSETTPSSPPANAQIERVTRRQRNGGRDVAALATALPPKNPRGAKLPPAAPSTSNVPLVAPAGTVHGSAVPVYANSRVVTPASVVQTAA